MIRVSSSTWKKNAKGVTCSILPKLLRLCQPLGRKISYKKVVFGRLESFVRFVWLFLRPGFFTGKTRVDPCYLKFKTLDKVLRKISSLVTPFCCILCWRPDEGLTLRQAVTNLLVLWSRNSSSIRRFGVREFIYICMCIYIWEAGMCVLFLGGGIESFYGDFFYCFEFFYFLN